MSHSLLLEKSMTYKTNWLRGILGPMLVSYASLASAVPAEMSNFGFHTLFIDNGAVFGMGSNKNGEIAPGSALEFQTPYFTGVMDAKSVATNYHRSVILKKDGTAIMTGMDMVTKQPTIKTLPASNITDVAVTQLDVFYVANGELVKLTDAGVATTLATNVKYVAAGYDHIVILFQNGTVGTFGKNSKGQLGNGTTTAATEVQVLGLSNVTQIAASEGASAAVTGSGTVYFFGSASNGKFGTNSTANVLTPQESSLTDVSKVLLGRGQTLVIKNDGTVWSAGWHNYIEGALYNTSPQFVQLPVGTAVDATVGTDHVVLDRGEVGKRAGWGGNIYGKLGLGDNVERHVIEDAFFTPIAPPPEAAVTPVPEPEVQAPEPAASEPETDVTLPIETIKPEPEPEPEPEQSIVDTVVETVKEVVDAVVETVKDAVDAVVDVVDAVVEVIAPAPQPEPQPAPIKVVDKVKGNNGWGNGDQAAPGKSGSHNNAENSTRESTFQKAEREYKDCLKKYDEAKKEVDAARKSGDKKKRDDAKKKRDEAKKKCDEAKEKRDQEKRKKGG